MKINIFKKIDICVSGLICICLFSVSSYSQTNEPSPIAPVRCEFVVEKWRSIRQNHELPATETQQSETHNPATAVNGREAGFIGLVTLTSPSGGTCQSLYTSRGNFASLDVAFRDFEGHPVQRTVQSIIVWMPGHGHAVTRPLVVMPSLITSSSDRFQISGINFPMPGLYRIEVRTRSQSSTTPTGDAGVTRIVTLQDEYLDIPVFVGRRP